MPKPISDLVRQQIKREIKKDPKADKAAIATQYGVSIGTVKRLAKEVKDTEIPGSVQQVKVRAATQNAIAKLSDTDGGLKGADFQNILITLLTDLTENLSSASIKSREGAARAAVELMKCHREFYPPTMEDLIDQLLGLPDFEPVEFAKRLRARYDQAG